MKNIITLILLTFVLTNCNAQQIVNMNTFNQGNNFGKYFKDLDNHYEKFVGIWENTTGNKTFRVVLHKTEKMPMGSPPIEFYMDRIQGRFLMIENKGMPNETILYNSVKYFPASGQTSENVILAGAGDTKLFGIIDDTTVTENIGILNGNLTMKILNPNSFPLQTEWKVFIKGMTIEGEEFNVPKNLILTKQ